MTEQISKPKAFENNKEFDKSKTQLIAVAENFLSTLRSQTFDDSSVDTLVSGRNMIKELPQSLNKLASMLSAHTTSYNLKIAKKRQAAGRRSGKLTASEIEILVKKAEELDSLKSKAPAPNPKAK